MVWNFVLIWDGRKGNAIILFIYNSCHLPPPPSTQVMNKLCKLYSNLHNLYGIWMEFSLGKSIYLYFFCNTHSSIFFLCHTEWVPFHALDHHTSCNTHSSIPIITNQSTLQNKQFCVIHMIITKLHSNNVEAHKPICQTKLKRITKMNERRNVCYFIKCYFIFYFIMLHSL